MLHVIPRRLTSIALKSLCSSCKLLLTRSKSYYISTPIFYVNAAPHIGHLYSLTLADAACRWHKLKLGKNCRLVGGTDEHGLKVMQAASLKHMETINFCDEVASRFKELYKTFDIDCYDFVRTSEERHTTAVKHFWKSIYNNGYIYKGTYEGWYSTSDETFVSPTDVIECHDHQTGKQRHVYSETNNEVQWTQEVNYKFKLGQFVDRIREWIVATNAVEPESARNLVLSLLDKPSFDLSVSRDTSRVPWGIETPNDPTQTIYVWMDALVNYLTAAGYPDVDGDSFAEMWPADVHLVGVDIVKFHAVYWPAFLLAAGLPLPKKVVVHSHWTVDNVKMSKSIGNVVDPFAVAEKVTATGLRYFLLKQGVIENDCNYTNDLVFRTINADLANDIGNCLYRATAKHLNPSQTYPSFHENVLSSRSADDKFPIGSEEYQFVERVKTLPEATDQHAENFHFYNSIFEIAETVRRANMIVQRHQLWTYDVTNVEERAAVESLLYLVYEGLRVSGILLQPFVPDLASNLLNKLGVCDNSRTWENAKRSFVELNGEKETLVGQKLGSGGMLFKRLKL